MRFLKLMKTEHQKLFEENKILKESIAMSEKDRKRKKEKIIKIRQYSIETNSEEEAEDYESDAQEEEVVVPKNAN